MNICHHDGVARRANDERYIYLIADTHVTVSRYCDMSGCLGWREDVGVWDSEFASCLCFFDVAKGNFGDDAPSEWGAEAFGDLHGGEISGGRGG
jgi:hypothetical protein